MQKVIGNPEISEDGSEVLSGEALGITFVIENNEQVVNGEYTDPKAEAWEAGFIIEAQASTLLLAEEDSCRSGATSRSPR